MPEKMTPEEYEMLAKSPADAPHLVNDERPGSSAPEGVVEEDVDGDDS